MGAVQSLSPGFKPATTGTLRGRPLRRFPNLPWLVARRPSRCSLRRLRGHSRGYPPTRRQISELSGGARRRRFSVSAPRSTCRGRGGDLAAREREISRRDRFQADRAVFPERWKMAQRRKRDVLPAIDAPARMHVTCRRKCNVGMLHEYGPDLAQKGK
jgi:hypothetical protein